MITVVEIWQLKPELANNAAALMQEMDDMLGPPAHVHPGWCGHATFYQSHADPALILMMYPWRSRQLHEDLASKEEAALKRFYEQYCAAPREIHYYEELSVEVEHDHDGQHGVGVFTPRQP